MAQRVSFSRRHGGFVVSFNGDLAGMILAPSHDGTHSWRFISQWGDMSEYPNCFEAQKAASEAVLIDHHYPATSI